MREMNTVCTQYIEEKVVLPEQERMRIDTYVVHAGHCATRSLFKRQCKEILVNNHPAKISTLVKEGDHICVRLLQEKPYVFSPEDIPLDVLYEDDDVLFVNKAAGMVVHPGKGNRRGTLANACASYLVDEDWGAGADHERLGIVHRLDADTSGVIVVAKHEGVHAWLSDAFAQRTVEKEYRAVVKGRPKIAEQSIETYIKRDVRRKTQFIVDHERGKWAITTMRCLNGGEYNKKIYSYVALFPKTGRTHQLRVHMKYIGCPILGDAKYARSDAVFADATLHLHAYRLRVPRYHSTERYDVVAPLPDNFQTTLQKLQIISHNV